MNILGTLEDRFERWLTAPAVHAAGRIGLARIVYCLFYLWILARLHYTEAAQRIPIQWEPTTIFSTLPPPTANTLSLGESLLAALLVLLLVGFLTRWVTVGVLIVGCLLMAADHAAFLADRTSALTVFFVPLLMTFSRWGSTYSLDFLLRKRRGQPVPGVMDSAWQYIWPAQALLLILAFLFMTGGFRKLRSGDWLAYPDWLSGLLYSKSVISYLQNGTPMSPLVPLLVSMPILPMLGQYAVIVFEFTFPLVLFSRFFRALYLRTLPLFHIFNAFVLGIPFPFVLGLYVFFVDWQRLRPDRARLPFLTRIPSMALIAGAVLVAALTGLGWNTTPVPRFVFSLGGWLNNNYGIWGVVFVGWLVWNLADLVGWHRTGRTRAAQSGAMAP